MIKIILLIFFYFGSIAFSQYQEATITRTTSTNSVFPRQFPSMTIRKMNTNEYWIFESLGTNTIFHRQFPTYIVRRSNYGDNHPSQKWAVYRTTSTNSVFPRQFPDRYISELEPTNNAGTFKDSQFFKNTQLKQNTTTQSENISSSYSYSKTLRLDGKASYNPEAPE